MDFGHAYMLNWAGMISTASPNAVMLDYGCGSGQVAAAGLAGGMNIRGIDPFYKGASSGRDAEESNLLGGSVFEFTPCGHNKIKRASPATQFLVPGSWFAK